MRGIALTIRKPSAARETIMDALSQTLRAVRQVGAIFINARFTAPWCHQSPSADTAAPFLEPGGERVVMAGPRRAACEPLI